MSPGLLIILSVVEILALVGVLAFYLVLLAKLLNGVAANLHAVADGVQSIEGHLTILAAVPMVNRTLDDIAGALPVVARTANLKAQKIRH
jgi:hypothetical protein